MPMQSDNIRLAKDVLNGEPIAFAARKYGKSKGRVWQITRAFCLEYMLDCERTDDDGNLKNLSDLRRAWRDFYATL